MRKLTASQKKLIDITLTSDKEINSVDTIPNLVWLKLEAINNTKILYQEVNRYIVDKRMVETYL